MRRIIPPLPARIALSAAILVAACGGAASTSSPSPAASASIPAVSPSAEPSLPAASPSAAESASPSASAATDAVEIVAEDYSYGNVPASTPAGTAFTMRNAGAEAHELVLVRRNAGVTESFEELLQLPEEEVFNLITVTGQVMANPGETAQGEVVADQPGDYMMICFFPVGMTEIPEGTPGPDASLPIGPPHFTQGMLAEFTVQ